MFAFNFLKFVLCSFSPNDWTLSRISSSIPFVISLFYFFSISMAHFSIPISVHNYSLYILEIHIRVSNYYNYHFTTSEFFTPVLFNGVWVTASILKSPGLFSVFWTISITMRFSLDPSSNFRRVFLIQKTSPNPSQKIRPTDSLKRTCCIKDFAIQADNRVKIKEGKKRCKHIDLVGEQKTLWNMKIAVTLIITGAL